MSMGLDIGPCSWSTTHRAILHIQQMPLLASWINLHPGGKQAQMKDGWFTWNGQKVMQLMIFPVAHPEFPNQPKGWSRSSRNVAFGLMASWWSAEINVQLTQSIVVPNTSLRCNWISRGSVHLSRRSLKQLATSASFSWSSIVNSTSLNISGVQSRSTYIYNLTGESTKDPWICSSGNHQEVGA